MLSHDFGECHLWGQQAWGLRPQIMVKGIPPAEWRSLRGDTVFPPKPVNGHDWQLMHEDIGHVLGISRYEHSFADLLVTCRVGSTLSFEFSIGFTFNWMCAVGHIPLHFFTCSSHSTPCRRHHLTIAASSTAAMPPEAPPAAG